MLRTLKLAFRDLLEATSFGAALYAWRRRRRKQAQMSRWIAAGKPPPPPHAVKADVLRRYAAAYHLRVLVETGTQRGNMLAELKDEFVRLYSVEIVPEVFAAARRRFRHDPQIELFCGDSATVLPQIIARLDEPALFWLDGHHFPQKSPSGKQVTPILAELAHLFAAPRLGHVVVIDDIRLFEESTGYPALATVLDYVNQDDGWDTLIEDDSLRLTPRASVGRRVEMTPESSCDLGSTVCERRRHLPADAATPIPSIDHRHLVTSEAAAAAGD